MGKRLRLGPFTGVLCLVLCAAPAAAGSRNLGTVYQDATTTSDPFVSRAGAEGDQAQFARGALGVLLPTYDRQNLFLAYRALTLDRATLDQQAAATPAAPFYREPQGGVQAWLGVRAGVVAQPPQYKPGQYHRFGQGALGGYFNCGNAAFNLAAQTLQSLQSDATLRRDDMLDWVAAQDAVFAFCGDPDPALPPPALPAALDAGAPQRLRQLRDYQIAAATFYSGNYDEALRRFDAIAADRAQPLRAWAAHSALRAMLRKASLDDGLARRVFQLRQAGMGETQLQAAFDAAWRDDQARLDQAFGGIAARAKAVLADPAFAAVEAPTRALLEQARQMLVPEQAYAAMTEALARFDQDPLRNHRVWEWSALGDRLFDGRGHAAFGAALRGHYEFFDWIRTIQGCTDNPASPNFGGQCAQEQAHALQKWQVGHQETWLVATLVTASQLQPALQSALDAARKRDPAAVDYQTLSYHAMRLLRSARRYDEARAVLDAAQSHTDTVGSAANLFRQERLAMAASDSEALPNLLRSSGSRIVRWLVGADGDLLLNRSLSAGDLLRLSGNGAAPVGLTKQLLVAAWWRADMVGDGGTARAAAQRLHDSVTELRPTTEQYLQAGDDDSRRYAIATAAMGLRLSPQVGRIPAGEFARASRGYARVADWWCSFDRADAATAAGMQRIPGILPPLAADRGVADDELARLRQQGTAADWLARIALVRARTQANDPLVRGMLAAVVASSQLDCTGPDSDSLVSQAQQALAAGGH